MKVWRNICILGLASRFLFGKTLLEPATLGVTNCSISPQHADLLYEGGRHKLPFFGRHHEDGFNIGVQFGVHAGHLKFIFKVGCGAQTAKNAGGLRVPCKVHEQCVEAADLDGATFITHVGDILFQQGFAFFHREQWAFAAANGDGDDQMIHHAACPAYELQVTFGHGVKRAGIDASEEFWACGHETQ